MAAKVYLALASVALALHLLFNAWVVLGAFWTRHRPGLRLLHFLSLLYAMVIVIVPWPCPLTLAENWFKIRAGQLPYEGSFLLHYLAALVYPNVSQAVVVWGMFTVCLGNLAVYTWRHHHYREAW